MKKEEALNILRNLHDNAQFSVRTALETLVPELKLSKDELTRREIIGILREYGRICEKNGNSCSSLAECVSYMESIGAKEKFDRMAPVYNNRDSFEAALDKAWKFYNKSGSITVDGFEDNKIELAFAKGFREGFICFFDMENKGKVKK